MKMKKGTLANLAVDLTVSRIKSWRLNDPSQLTNVTFCFPRVLTDFDDDWTDGSAFLAGAAAIARNPDNSVNKDIPLRHYKVGHKIPSVFVPLNGIRDVEYHVSRMNLERLLSVGCIVFQPYRKGFGVRIPYGHPMLTGQPFEFEIT